MWLKRAGIFFAGLVIGGSLVFSILTNRQINSVNQNLSDTDKALKIVENIEEVEKIRGRIEKAGNSLLITPEGEQNDEVTIIVSEGLSDHVSRIVTFHVHIPSKVVTIDDVVNAKRISLEEWQKQVRLSWGF